MSASPSGSDSTMPARSSARASSAGRALTASRSVPPAGGAGCRYDLAAVVTDDHVVFEAGTAHAGATEQSLDREAHVLLHQRRFAVDDPGRLEPRAEAMSERREEVAEVGAGAVELGAVLAKTVVHHPRRAWLVQLADADAGPDARDDVVDDRHRSLEQVALRRRRLPPGHGRAHEVRVIAVDRGPRVDVHEIALVDRPVRVPGRDPEPAEE